jgi:hypothetical protein
MFKTNHAFQWFTNKKGGRYMFNANFMLAQAIQKDHLRMARRERVGRQMIEYARKKLLAKRTKKENR